MAFGAYIQSVGQDSGAGISTTLAYPSNLIANNILILLIRFGSDPGTITVTDTRGHTWVLLRNINNSIRGVMYYVLSCTAGANTVTVENTISAVTRIALLEYTGPAVLDDSDSGADAESPASTPALVTTVPTELIVAGLVTGDDSNFTPGSGFTQRITTTLRLAVEDRLVTSTGSYTPDYTFDSIGIWVMIAGSFFESVTGIKRLEGANRGLNRGLNVRIK